MNYNVKDLLKAIGKGILFFIIWAIILPFSDFIALPKFISSSSSLTRLWYELLPFIITMIITCVFRKLSGIKKDRRAMDKVLKDSLSGIIIGISWILLTILLLKIFGIISITKGSIPKDLLIYIVALFLNTVMQEYLVRGYMFEIISKSSNLLIGSIFTTIIFTALHGGAFEVGTVGVLNVITMSIFMTQLLIYSKGLTLPIIVHFMWNLIGGMVIGGVSLASDYPYIYEVAFEGSKLLSGGSFKMEGSIVVLFVNILMIVFMFLKNKNYKFS